MKNIVFALSVALFSSLVVHPSSLFAATDPNPYADYGKAMASAKDAPMAVEWHNQNAEAIEEATEPSVLAGFVEDFDSAKALLDRLQGAYATCPLVLTQIAAVTQWVMLPEPSPLCFWKPSPAAGRKVWVAALEKRCAEAQDDYVRTFCRQQLDLCR